MLAVDDARRLTIFASRKVIEKKINSRTLKRYYKRIFRLKSSLLKCDLYMYIYFRYITCPYEIDYIFRENSVMTRTYRYNRTRVTTRYFTL